MWASWVKSPARIHNRSPSFDYFSSAAAAADSSTPPPYTPPRTPLHHHHSVSFKDVETLHNSLPPPLSPLHKRSLSSFKPPPPPVDFPTTPTRHRPISFKDIHSLLSESNPTRKPFSIFHRVRAWANRHHNPPPPPPESQNRVVIYYTSLRVVRKTFEECRAVRSIIKAYRVKIDERDVSMDDTFLEELQRIIGSKREKRDLSLPRVFVNGVYVGGAEEIRRLHESGDLRRVIQGLPPADGGVCGGCGGFRYVLCDKCDGSHRVYTEKVGFKSCNRCNVNGLIRCSSCTSVVF